MVIIILSALQSFSGACLALMHSYKQAINTIKLVNQTPPRPHRETNDTKPSPASDTKPPTPIIDSQRPPSIVLSRSLSSKSSAASSHLHTELAPSLSVASLPNNLPQDYAVAPLLMISEIFNTRNRFAATLFLTTLSMASSSMTPFLDKLLPFLLQRFLSPSFILNITRLSKRTLFPNGYPGPPPTEPSPEEQAAIRAKLIAWRGRGAVCRSTPSPERAPD